MSNPARHYIAVPPEHWNNVAHHLTAAGYVLHKIAPAGPSHGARYDLRDGGAVQVSARELTDREAQVLASIASGLSNGEIGKALGLPEDTVKTHNRRLFNKLGARDRAHAVHVAWQRGLFGGAGQAGDPQ